MKAPFFSLLKKICLLCFTSELISCATIKVEDYEITQFPVDNQIRIVHVSDFHSNDFGKDESKLVRRILDARPDVIFFTGDTFEYNRKKNKTTENVKKLLKGIKGSAPFYYVTGNHEYFYYHNDDYAYIIKEYGGTVLRNETAILELKQGIIEITGLDDPFADMSLDERALGTDNKEKYLARLKLVSENAMKIKASYKDNPDFAFSVLLAHRPEYINEYLKYNYDLILSGHAHGGQWRFPPFINGLYAPMQGFFPKYAGGRYDFSENGTVFIVSRGLSYQVPDIPRFFNPPELVVIEVK